MYHKPCDILIVGGAVIGSAIAYFLSEMCPPETRIIVVERDASYAQSSTALSAASIRVQFSSSINIKMSLFGAKFLRQFETLFTDGLAPVNLRFRENGYLFLAETPRQCQVLRQNHALQKAQRADVKLLEDNDITDRFPYINSADIGLSSLGISGEGWFDNMGLLNGFKALAKARGVTYLCDSVIGFGMKANRIITANLASGEKISVGDVVNAAGPACSKIAAMAGLNLPVEPRKRTTFVIQTPAPPPENAPLVVDPHGVYFRPEGDLWICAMQPTPDPLVAHDDFEPRYQEFDDHIWPLLAHRSHLFDAVKVRRQWAGHYAFNTFDQNAIVGRHPVVSNFICANGFSGHGLQQAPAIGRAIGELITSGRFETLDLTPLGVERILNGHVNLEKNIV